MGHFPTVSSSQFEFPRLLFQTPSFLVVLSQQFVWNTILGCLGMQLCPDILLNKRSDVLAEKTTSERTLSTLCKSWWTSSASVCRTRRDKSAEKKTQYTIRFRFFFTAHASLQHTTIMSSRLLGSASPLARYLCRSQQVRITDAKSEYIEFHSFKLRDNLFCLPFDLRKIKWKLLWRSFHRVNIPVHLYSNS